MSGPERDARQEERPIVAIQAAAAGARGLRAIELLCREGLTLRRLDCRIELVGATPAQRRLLERAGLGDILPCARGDGRGSGGAEPER